MKYKAIGWVRDSKGQLIRNVLRTTHVNCLTSFCGRGYADQNGLGNTTPIY